ncbi:MAG: TolC family protein [Gemmatimonadota bacterium]
MNRQIGIGLVLAAAWSSPLRAQQMTMTDSLLDRLTREAVHANASLGAASSRARAFDARIRPAGTLPDPTVMVGVMDLTLPNFAFRQSDFTEIDVQAEQAFPWPGTLSARTRSAAGLAQAAHADLRDRERDLTLRVAEIYYQLRYTVTARASLVRQRTGLAGIVDAALTRYSIGEAPQSDALQARTVLARLDADAAALAGEEASLRSQLRRARNVRGTDSLEIQPVTDDEPAMMAHGMSEPWSVPLAPAPDDPRLVASRARATAATEMVEAERLGGRPEFTITARYGARPLGADFASAFVGVRIPLWSGRKQKELINSAAAEADAARADVAESEAALRSEIEQMTAVAAAGHERLVLLVDRVLPSAAAAVEAALRGYRLGQARISDVLSAQDTEYRTRLETALAVTDHLNHLVMLGQLARQGAAQ